MFRGRCWPRLLVRARGPGWGCWRWVLHSVANTTRRRGVGEAPLSTQQCWEVCQLPDDDGGGADSARRGAAGVGHPAHFRGWLCPEQLQQPGRSGVGAQLKQRKNVASLDTVSLRSSHPRADRRSPATHSCCLRTAGPRCTQEVALLSPGAPLIPYTGSPPRDSPPGPPEV